jgi:hypothetical protein
MSSFSGSTQNQIFSSLDGTAVISVLNKNLSQFPLQAKNMEVSLSSLFVNYIWNNVSAAIGNNTYSYSFNGTVFGPYTLLDGQYLIGDISGAIQLQMQTNGHFTLNASGQMVFYLSIAPNATYNAATVTCSPITLSTNGTNPHNISLSGNVPLLILSGGLATTLGYGAAQISLPAVTQTTTFMSNSTQNPVLDAITFVSLNCNLVSASVWNPNLPTSLYIFSPTVEFGSQINVTVQNQRWFPILDGLYTNISLNLTGPNGQSLLLKDPSWGANIDIRPRS